jgi:uncharacterized protein GlcG (DUF336 family)
MTCVTSRARGVGIVVAFDAIVTDREELMQATIKAMILAALTAMSTAAAAQTAGATFTVRHLTPETALKAVNAALNDCRKRGFQVAVAVVDRAGVVQALVRDRFAGTHTSDTAIGKGWTAASFRTNTTELAKITQPGQPSSGIRGLPRVVAVGGGVLIEAGGNILGAIGVSGAPGGDQDDLCAKAGIAAIRDDIEL